MSQPVLNVSNIRKTFGGVVALNGVNMDIEGGKINFDGLPNDLLNSPELGSLYLGIGKSTG